MSRKTPNGDIRNELDSNFESYTQNPILNQLTPSRNRSHMDSNIVTSPVKTMRKSYQPDEYDTTNENTRHTRHSSVDKSTINVPLNDSSKPLLRKGTPKNKTSKSKKIATSFTSTNLEKAVFGSKNATLSQKDSKILDEFDDDEFDDEKSNKTLLSDLPNDILSPEKHVYPTENLHSSKDGITNTILQRVELYPDLTKPLPSSPQKISTSTHIINSRTNEIQKSVPRANNRDTSNVLNGSPKSIHRSPKKGHSRSKSQSKTNEDRLKSPVVPNLLPTTKEPLGLSSPARRIIPQFENQNIPDLTSPAKRVLPEDNSILSSISKYESSEEELEVPQITSPLVNESYSTSKRRNSSETSSARKKILKKDTLYPSLVPDYKLNNSSVENKTVTSHVTIKSLYPIIPRPDRVLDDSITKPNGQSTTANFNISSKPNGQSTTNLTSTLKLNPLEKRVNDFISDEPATKETNFDRTTRETSIEKPFSKELSIDEVSVQRATIEPTRVTESEIQREVDDLPSGGPDSWNRGQWKLFFDLYQIYKDEDNLLRKDEIFNAKVLKILRCDLRDIQAKINFTNQYHDEIKSGQFR